MVDADKEFTDSTSLSVARIMMFGPMFAIVLSSAHLLGYWISFNVSPFQYLSLSDIVVQAIPLMPLLFLSLVFLFTILPLIRSPFLKEGRTVSAPLSWVTSALAVGSFIAAYIIVTDPFDNVISQFFAGCVLFAYLVAALFYFFHFSFSPSLSLTERRLINLTVLLALVLTPFAALGLGINLAQDIKKGQIYRYVPVETAGPDVMLNLRFLGNLGDYHFFYDPQTRTTRMVRADTLPTLDIKLYYCGEDQKTIRWTCE